MKNKNQITVNMENLTNEEREQLLKLVKKSNEQQPKKRWRGEYDEEYYFIDYCNKIDAWKELNYKTDKGLYELGNYFKTEEEAEFELNKRLVYQELKDYALEHNENDVDWTNVNQLKWGIFYDNESKCLDYDYWYTRCYIGQIHFYSEETAREAVKAVGENRIKKYLFGVE